ncbi:MAG: hypothetical protein QOD86_2642 [Miltoncostaeaceae bacterium]|nr:hypothetical protein [Miltoncostaeaceae bacterium]
MPGVRIARVDPEAGSIPIFTQHQAGAARPYHDPHGPRGSHSMEPEQQKAPGSGGFGGADEGTRTLDLLHGKQTL